MYFCSHLWEEKDLFKKISATLLHKKEIREIKLKLNIEASYNNKSTRYCKERDLLFAKVDKNY